jgi:hypothetical protein
MWAIDSGRGDRAGAWHVVAQAASASGTTRTCDRPLRKRHFYELSLIAENVVLQAYSRQVQ